VSLSFDAHALSQGLAAGVIERQRVIVERLGTSWVP
jgi:hypothetical protein